MIKDFSLSIIKSFPGTHYQTEVVPKPNMDDKKIDKLNFRARKERNMKFLNYIRDQMK